MPGNFFGISSRAATSAPSFRVGGPCVVCSTRAELRVLRPPRGRAAPPRAETHLCGAAPPPAALSRRAAFARAPRTKSRVSRGSVSPAASRGAPRARRARATPARISPRPPPLCSPSTERLRSTHPCARHNEEIYSDCVLRNTRHQGASDTSRGAPARAPATQVSALCRCALLRARYACRYPFPVVPLAGE